MNKILIIMGLAVASVSASANSFPLVTEEYMAEVKSRMIVIPATSCPEKKIKSNTSVSNPLMYAYVVGRLEENQANEKKEYGINIYCGLTYGANESNDYIRHFHSLLAALKSSDNQYARELEEIMFYFYISGKMDVNSPAVPIPLLERCDNERNYEKEVLKTQVVDGSNFSDSILFKDLKKGELQPSDEL